MDCFRGKTPPMEKILNTLSDFMNKWRPADFIGLVVIVFGFVLIYNGINGLVGSLVAMIVAFYFGKRERNDDQKDNSFSKSDRRI